MRFLFVVHKNEEKAEQNSVLFHRLTLKERGLRPNGYFPLMRQPRPCQSFLILILYHNPCIQILPYEGFRVGIVYEFMHKTHKSVLRHLIKEFLQVDIDNVGISVIEVIE